MDASLGTRGSQGRQLMVLRASLLVALFGKAGWTFSEKDRRADWKRQAGRSVNGVNGGA